MCAACVCVCRCPARPRREWAYAFMRVVLGQLGDYGRATLAKLLWAVPRWQHVEPAAVQAFAARLEGRLAEIEYKYSGCGGAVGAAASSISGSDASAASGGLGMGSRPEHSDHHQHHHQHHHEIDGGGPAKALVGLGAAAAAGSSLLGKPLRRPPERIGTLVRSVTLTAADFQVLLPDGSLGHAGGDADVDGQHADPDAAAAAAGLPMDKEKPGRVLRPLRRRKP